ncbi:hypothetical protein [Bacillus dakarensis]|uniref:hypothetical protein n=1 Tax=Robertmurraya dakarensis TaxID=1926278 RepID=UPI00098093B6|nr:hypothetical protein [Bacillus dakarensis]
MKKISILFLIILLLLGACGTNGEHDVIDEKEGQNEQVNKEEDGAGDEVAEEDAEQPTSMPELEETKTVEMLIEGTTEEKVVKLHHHEQLGFSTYVPEDMVVESDVQVFNVYTNFEGVKNEDARLFVVKLTEKKGTDYLEEAGFTLTEVNNKAYEFSEKEYSIKKKVLIGRVSTFTQNDESYMLGYYYPSEYGDGFSARSNIIVDEMVWHNE